MINKGTHKKSRSVGGLCILDLETLESDVKFCVSEMFLSTNIICSRLKQLQEKLHPKQSVTVLSFQPPNQKLLTRLNELKVNKICMFDEVTLDRLDQLDRLCQERSLAWVCIFNIQALLCPTEFLAEIVTRHASTGCGYTEIPDLPLGAKFEVISSALITALQQSGLNRGTRLSKALRAIRQSQALSGPELGPVFRYHAEDARDVDCCRLEQCDVSLESAHALVAARKLLQQSNPTHVGSFFHNC